MSPTLPYIAHCEARVIFAPATASRTDIRMLHLCGAWAPPCRAVAPVRKFRRLYFRRAPSLKESSVSRRVSGVWAQRLSS